MCFVVKGLDWYWGAGGVWVKPVSYLHGMGWMDFGDDYQEAVVRLAHDFWGVVVFSLAICLESVYCGVKGHR